MRFRRGTPGCIVPAVDKFVLKAIPTPIPAVVTPVNMACIMAQVQKSVLERSFADGSLRFIATLLRVDGTAILSTPYDWSQGVTPVEAWIGGHSQRGFHQGGGESLLRDLLTPGGHPQSVEGLRLVAEAMDVPWQERLHNRNVVSYSVHLCVAEAINGDR